MSIVNQIMSAVADARTKHGKRPDMIYMSEAAWRDLCFETEKYRPHSDAYTHVAGCRIVKSDWVSGFIVAYELEETKSG